VAEAGFIFTDYSATDHIQFGNRVGRLLADTSSASMSCVLRLPTSERTSSHTWRRLKKSQLTLLHTLSPAVNNKPFLAEDEDFDAFLTCMTRYRANRNGDAMSSLISLAEKLVDSILPLQLVIAHRWLER
jgi:hypothetical protein